MPGRSLLVTLVALGIAVGRLGELLGLGLDGAARAGDTERECERERESTEQRDPAGCLSPSASLHSSSHEDPGS